MKLWTRLKIGFNNLGLINRFVVAAAIIGLFLGAIYFVITFSTGATKEGQEEIKDLVKGSSEERPHLAILLTNNFLELYVKKDTFALSYMLENKGDGTAYNIKKGHMRLDLPDKNLKGCKRFYEPENLVDVLIPHEKSTNHKDDIGKLDHNKSYKLQLVITYTSSKNVKEKVYYASAIFEIKPYPRGDKLFRVLSKLRGADEGLVNAKDIIESINSCEVIK